MTHAEIRAACEALNPERFGPLSPRETLALLGRLEELELEESDLHKLCQRQAGILTGVVNAIRGEPGPLRMHSHHDAAELVKQLVLERDLLKAAIIKPESFAGIVSGEVAAENKRLTDSTATARGLLAEIEYAGRSEYGTCVCPMCHSTRRGHSANCKLVAFLEATK